MRKQLGFSSLVLLMTLTVSACFGTTSTSVSSSVSSEISSESTVSSSVVTLSTITFSGADDVTVDYESTFNALTGVTATGNDGNAYTSSIVLQSTSAAVNLTTGAVDTTKSGVHAIRYNVSVGTVLAQKWRNVTVKAPEAVEGEMLVNPDFATSTAGWDDAANGLYIADGAAMTLSVDSGALKAEVTAGSNVYTPRFGQMNVPFEQDKVYKVSFDAKSSVAKTINLQVGELLSSDPWFVDFKPKQTEHRLITTEWANYYYKFTHTLDNQRGGVLFELGKIGSEQINATVWFDNIKVEESTLDVDTTAPDLTGVLSTVNLTLGATYDPLGGVTAYDLTDGDVTEEIVVEIKNSADEVVLAVDTSAEGTFTVTYTVEDSLGNSRSATTTVTVSALLFKATNIVANGSFAADLTVDKPEWAMWVQNWGTAPVASGTLDKTAGTYSVAIAGGGDASWAVQLFQDGYINLVEGKTYRVKVTASSTVQRSISVALGYGESWVEYGRKNGMVVGATSGSSEFIFTVTQPTHDVKLVLELGAQAGFADGTLVLEEIAIQELDAAPILPNSDLGMTGWKAFFNDWEGSSGSAAVVNGEYVITINKFVNTNQTWLLQLLQDESTMGISSTSNGVIDLLPNTTYTFSFDAYASEAMNIHPLIISSNNWVNLVAEADRTKALTTTKQTFTATVTTGAEVFGNEILKFEFGDAFASFDGTPKTVTFDNIVVKDSAEAAVTTVFNGTFDQVLGGYSFYSEGNGTMTSNGSAAVINVTSVGGAAYVPHFFYIMPTLAVGDYTFTFTIASTVTRDLRVNIILPDQGYASILPGNKYDFAVQADGTLKVTVNFSVETSLTNVKIELDFGTLGDEFVSIPGVFTIEDIMIYPVIG